MARNDWMPAKMADRLELAKRWNTVLNPAKFTKWNIPEEMGATMLRLTLEAERAWNTAHSANATDSDRQTMRNSLDVLVAQMRDLRRRYFFIPPLTEPDHVDLGIPIPDNVRTPHIDVTEAVDFVIRLRSIRELVVDFWEHGTSGKAKPAGYDGAVIIWHISETAPERPDDFHYHEMASATPHILHFDEADRGKKVWVALAWQNARGYKGQWSEFKSAFVP